MMVTTVKNSIGLDFFGLLGGVIGQQQDIKLSLHEITSKNYVRYVERTWLFQTQRKEYDVLGNVRETEEVNILDLKFLFGLKVVYKK